MIFVARCHLSVLNIHLDLLIHPFVDILAAEAVNNFHYTKRDRDVCNKPNQLLVFLSTIDQHEKRAHILDTTSNNFFVRYTIGSYDGCIVGAGKVCRT